MIRLAIRERRPQGLRGFSMALVAGSMLAGSTMANAAPAPESFSGLAKKVTSAVVNIASTHEAKGSENQMPELPFDFPEGSPFEKYFRQFGERGRQAGPRMATGLGSGFIIDQSGYVVTNNHVVDGAKEVTVKLDDDSVYPAKVVGVDPLTDVALLKIDAKRSLPAVQFGDSDKAEVGDWVMAVGNPFGLGGTVTAGIVSARDRIINAGPYDDFLQIDASINQGNSGGPLFSTDGAVIGVNTAIYSPNGGNIGIGFAVPSNIVKSVVAQLKESGRVERGWLGVQIQKLTPEIASAVGLKEAQGAMVVDVTPDSPAAKAGMKQGDIVVNFAGQKIVGPRDLGRVVAQEPSGSKTKLTIWRDGNEKVLAVVTGTQPAQPRMADNQPTGEQQGAYRATDLNADLAPLSSERRAELGIGDDIKGVLVLDVKEGSVFEQGLRAGDIIQQVGQTPVTSPKQVDDLVQKAKAGPEKSVLMLVNRQGHDLFLGLKLGID